MAKISYARSGNALPTYTIKLDQSRSVQARDVFDVASVLRIGIRHAKKICKAARDGQIVETDGAPWHQVRL